MLPQLSVSMKIDFKSTPPPLRLAPPLGSAGASPLFRLQQPTTSNKPALPPPGRPRHQLDWITRTGMPIRFSFTQIQRRIVLALYAITLTVSGQTIPGQIESNLVHYHENLPSRFKAGDTNVPLLRVDSLKGPVCTCNIEKNGRVITSGSNGISNWTDWNRPLLTATNLQALNEAINRLPPSTTGTIPLRRQIHVSGIRSNECFHAVYDVDDLPGEVCKVLKIIGAPFSAMVTSPGVPPVGSDQTREEPTKKTSGNPSGPAK